VNRTKLALGILGVAVTLLVAWVLFVGLPRWAAGPPAPVEEPAAATPATPAPATEPSAPQIKAHLFYVTDDGARLRAEEREVPFGDTTADQARRIVEAELEPPPPPFVSAIPEGTTLRELFIGEHGQAYVDLSGEVSKNHPGGSQDEILTVYAIVDALTDNLPAISAVQILIDGREVDTLAGHVDLRRPLRKNLAWVESPAPIPPSVPQ
jgi:spore germination protein GerM